MKSISFLALLFVSFVLYAVHAYAEKLPQAVDGSNLNGASLKQIGGMISQMNDFPETFTHGWVEAPEGVDLAGMFAGKHELITTFPILHGNSFVTFWKLKKTGAMVLCMAMFDVKAKWPFSDKCYFALPDKELPKKPSQ